MIGIIYSTSFLPLSPLNLDLHVFNQPQMKFGCVGLVLVGITGSSHWRQQGWAPQPELSHHLSQKQDDCHQPQAMNSFLWGIVTSQDWARPCVVDKSWSLVLLKPLMGSSWWSWELKCSPGQGGRTFRPQQVLVGSASLCHLHKDSMTGLLCHSPVHLISRKSEWLHSTWNGCYLYRTLVALHGDKQA